MNSHLKRAVCATRSYSIDAIPSIQRRQRCDPAPTISMRCEYYYQFINTIDKCQKNSPFSFSGKKVPLRLECESVAWEYNTHSFQVQKYSASAENNNIIFHRNVLIREFGGVGRQNMTVFSPEISVCEWNTWILSIEATSTQTGWWKRSESWARPSWEKRKTARKPFRT